MEHFYICHECGELATESGILEEIGNCGGPGLCSCLFSEMYYNEEINDLDVKTNRIFTQWTEISKKWYEDLKGWENHVVRLRVFRGIPKNKLLSNYHVKLKNKINEVI